MANEKGEKTQLYFKGANSDVNVEIQSLGEGVYLYAINMRLSQEGDQDILTKIGDEEDQNTQIHTDLSVYGTDYACVGACMCNGHKIALWANFDGPPTHEHCLSIDDNVMLASTDFPISEPYPNQIIVNENASGGEIYFHDKQFVPLIFNVQDIIDEWNAGSPSTKYFTDFDIRLYKAQLISPVNVPVFVGLEHLGANNGLSRGCYTYSMRYVAADGSGTDWGPSTFVIPVPEKIASVHSYFNIDGGVYGGVPDLTNPTKYGIRLRLRVTNEGEYSHIELKRLSYNTAQSLDYIPVAEKTIVTEIDITSNPFSIIDVIDSNERVWTTIPPSELESSSAVEKVNTITYFDNRLIEMGPTYESQIIDSTGLFLSHNENDKVAYPYIKKLYSTPSNPEEYGYVDIWNQVYHKSYMRGEKYGFAVVVYTSIGGISFAVPYYDGSGATGIGDFRNYQFPNRRETISNETDYVSEETVYCADVDSHDNLSNSHTHEVFGMGGIITKNIDTINISNAVSIYHPLKPTGSEGVYNSRTVSLDGFGTYPCDQAEGNAYNPPGTNPIIYAMGLQFQGIDETVLPDGSSGFSIARTKPAGRIVCQGLAVYALGEGDPATNTPATKDTDNFWFYSPDIDPALNFNSGLLDELVESGGDYKLQLVCPLGFWSELYSGNNIAGDGAIVDFISYAKMIYEDNIYNPANNAAATIGWRDGYISFGRWRNHAAAGAGNVDMSAAVFADIYGDLSWHIDGISVNTVEGHEGRSVYLNIDTATLYNLNNPVGQNHNHATVTKWHEPVYIVNIIKESADVDVTGGNVQKYYSTGHYQKLNSLIGFGTDDVLSLELVDERYEDVIVDEHIYEGSHDGGNNVLVLSDATKVWGTNALIGYTIINTTDHSWGIIVSNTVNTATVIGLSGGTDNDFDTNDTYIIIRECDYVYKGTHTGANNQPNLTDALKTWDTDELVGYTVKNVTDGSWAVITANVASTVTTSLAGGTDNDWDTGDEYWISANRYVYVDDKPWLTNIPLGKYATIIAALGASGKWDDGNREIYGVCKGNYRLDRSSTTLLSIIYFDNSYFDDTYGGAVSTNYTIPEEDLRIEVRYDNRIPIKVFGGDTFVNESIWADLDSEMEWGKTEAQNEANCWGLSVAYPYHWYDTTAQYWQPTTGGARVSNVQVILDYIRQHVWQFVCESKVNLNLQWNDVFPKKHYVMRPLQISDTDILLGATDVYDDNDVLPQYEDDYGDEYLLWQYGGFKFPVIEANRAYSAYLNGEFFYSSPQVGFEEQLYFPNKVLFSQERVLPGVIGAIKSFPVLNTFDIMDFAGEIKFACFANTVKGDNLYAITEKGVCLLITNKSILSSLTGEEVLMTGANDFILGQYWTSKDYGMNDEMWRTATVYNNMLYWVNNESVFSLIENKVEDIGRKGFYNALFTYAIDQIGAGYSTDVSGVIDQKHKEFWFVYADNINPKIFVYDLIRGFWIGYFEPSSGITGFYISDTQDVYHFKNNHELYRANQGYDTACEVVQVVTPALGKNVEFVDIKINSINRPTSVEFADSEKNLYQAILNSSKGDRYLRDYGYFYNKIPRKEREINGTHTGANNATVLTDSTQSWGINVLAGMIIYNDTDGSVGVIVSNTINTVTSEWQVDIDNIVDYGGVVPGTVKIQTATDHGFVTGQNITVDGTVNYDGVYAITVIDADEFHITVGYVADESGYGTVTGNLSGGTQNDWDGDDDYYIENTKSFRLQNRHMVYKITHSGNEPFKLISSTIGYKVLRIK